MGKFGSALKQIGNNLTQLTYCIYLAGYRAGETKGKKLSFNEFCAKIRQLHHQGKSIWNSQ